MNRIAIITRCGQCYHAHYDDVVAKWVCLETMKRLPANVTDYSPYCAPPDWCPLTPAADVGRVKPLTWERIRIESGPAGIDADVRNIAWAHAIEEYHESTAPAGRYAVRTNRGRWQCWSPADNNWQPCDDLADGQRKSDAHYRAALFAEDGPLAQIEVPK